MDVHQFNFDWNRARAFLVTAQEGSLSAASRILGLTQPTLGRQVSALEDELGVVLFERVGRGLSLTKGGLELVEHVRVMGDAANRVSLAASGQAQSVEGTVRITATEVTSAFILPPIVRRLRNSEPGISIEIIASNSIRDLRRREADIAIRSVRPTDPDLVARKLSVGRAHLYAANTYVDELGGLGTAEDFSNADFIGFEENEQFLEGLNGVGLNVKVSNFPVTTASHLVHWEMVKNGAGIGVMVDQVGDVEPCVRRVAPWIGPFEYEVWLVAHREVNTSRRVRLVFDRLASELA